MKHKRATLVVNPRAGQNLTKITEVLAVLAAAGWKTTLALKEYGGHSMARATEAAEMGQEIVIAYGGDGTLNQVLNGVMHANKRPEMVGLIPGGTANVWAKEVGIPVDPVQAALTLVESQVHRVDVGHIAIEHLEPSAQPDGSRREDKKARRDRSRRSASVRQHFLLMAGLGLDAAIMGHVSKPLKYRVGALAVGVSTAKELPAQHPFPVEIEVSQGEDEPLRWKGEALQVVIGNTRLYADIVEMTPDAYIDDGKLDLCVITGGNPLTTMQQIASLLLRHQPDTVTAERFQGAHFTIKVPASVALQLDGSAVKLKDYLGVPDRQALLQMDQAEPLMVTYRFDALPRALPVAIPRTYDGTLFEASHSLEEQNAQSAESQPEPEKTDETEQQDEPLEHLSEAERQTRLEEVQTLLEQGRKVVVAGISSQPTQKHAYIVAGTTNKLSTGEARPVAVCINQETHVLKSTGEEVPGTFVQKVRANDTIIVTGKKSKRGVITARQVLLT